MADFDSISDIRENFDTIKTLLNSIRAQGILNTSDVDKLLSGINAKLEKINTEEDIDLIKIFLSELKQNLDERHSVLISKFGAIESLFSNLLKNSSEMPKSAELKELFDIVATNLSVFSREVVSQKESLTDITLRLDALRSDDSQKKDIIKNISLLKPDLERLNNGFDSIVLSLNDNFKTIIKTITTLDKTEHLDKFADAISGMEMSSNTILSALQMLDKKTEQIETAIGGLATSDDIKSAKERLFELTAQSHELNASVSDLSNRYIKIDNLAEKIDASVNIIASLKSVLEEADNKNTATILDKLSSLETELHSITNDTKFEEFKASLENVLKTLCEGTVSLDEKLVTSVKKLETAFQGNIQDAIQKVAALQDASITRVLNDISTSADALNSKLNQTQSAIAVLCEKNFNSVVENISNIKTLISQIDENSVSANNAIFASITDRLTFFENSLKTSLDNQERSVNTSSAQIVEQMENLKNLSSVLDYKLDSSVVESGNVKRELSSLKTSVDEMLALDFVNTVKDLRVDLYASKQEIMNGVEASTGELNEKFTNDLYGKYELLISKLDSVEDELKQVQSAALTSLKPVLENISSSIIDVISYVSEGRTVSDNQFGGKLDEISEIVRENSINYVESVRDVVDVIRVQIENNLKEINGSISSDFDAVKKSISENSENLKKDLKCSYSKLLEIQDAYKEIKELLNLNSITSSDKFDGIIASAEDVKSEFESKLVTLKAALLDKITEFKQEFTCENADKVSEIKFAVENLYNKNSQEINELYSELKELISGLSTEDSNSRAATLAKILDNFVSLKSFISTLNDKTANDFTHQVDVILEDFEKVKAVLEKVDENVDGDMKRQLSIIESNFESLVSQLTILFDKSESTLTNKIDEEFTKISERMDSSVSERLENYKTKIEETFDRLQNRTIEQSSYLQERISDINTTLKSVWEEQSEKNYNHIEDMSEKLKAVLDDNIKLTAVDYASFREQLTEFSKNIETNNSVLAQDLKVQLDDITKYIDSVLDIQSQELEANHEELFSANNAVKELLEAKSSEIVNSTKSSEAEILKTMGELSIVTTEQIEELKNDSMQIAENIKANEVNHYEATKASLDKMSTSIVTSKNETLQAISEMQNFENQHYVDTKTSIEDLADAVNNTKTETLQAVNMTQSLENQHHTDIKSSINGLVETINDTNAETLQAVNATQNLENQHYTDTKDSIDGLVETVNNTKAETLQAVNALQSLENSNHADTKESINSLTGTINKNTSDTLQALETIQAIEEQRFEAVKTSNDSLINSVNNSKTETLQAIDNLKELEDQQHERARDLHAGLANALNELKVKSDKETDLIKQSINEVIKLYQEKAQNNSNEILSLSEICANNSSNILKNEAAAIERHETVLLKSENIINTVQNIASTAQTAALTATSTKNDIAELTKIVAESKEHLSKLDTSFTDNVSALNALTAEISAGELQTLDAYVNTILEQIEDEKQNVKICKDLIVEFTKKELEIISKNIEKETDIVIEELVEQFDLMKKSQTDDIINLTSKIEDIVSSQVYNNIEDLKSYLDIKTDNSILSGKIDNIKIDMTSYFENTLENIGKLLNAGIFSQEMNDFRLATELLISGAVNDINNKILAFIETNSMDVKNLVGEKFELFDEKFINTIVDKYEEIKIISNKSNDSFNAVQSSLNDILSRFSETKENITNRLEALTETVNSSNTSALAEIRELKLCFDSLRSQISNKSFDEAFQASINKQIAGIEDLISEQIGYIEDISELCVMNLPEVAELNTIVKHSVIDSLKNLNEKFDNQDFDITLQTELNEFKTEIITQFLNIFNQISFVTEQEEILDFINEKHEDLITILSHIVTTSADIENVKESVSVVDEKISSLKDDIEVINEKITAIMSSDGYIDYVYSLQDLEADIANLRVELNSIKENNNSEEFKDLLTSTNDIYALVETIKSELPNKHDIEGIAEDIVSISTRTNKLLLTSDESYKTLQDNLEDFKLVINDLDERTKNFAQDSGMDKVNAKLNAINSMMEKGAKTNQIFNQVFEYLAEWVDNAGVQINKITDKVGTLDEISQIKDMLAELKAGAEDNSETVELVEALGAVFDKQTKRISSLEAKLDKIIVETTINNRERKLDLSPMENTLNRFLAAIEEKMSNQQDKINSLETKLEDALNLLDGKDTAQLTKKVGGMDRQIAKLNKSIEKIASHVIDR